MAFEHRIKTTEQAEQIATPVTSSAGLRVVVGTAPINMLEDPDSVVNTPVLVNSFAEGVEKLGYSDDFEHFTISENLDYSFRKLAIAPIIFINVLDPETHTKPLSETVTVTAGKGTISKTGVMVKDLVVKNGETALVKGTDYTLSFDDNEYLVITLLTSASISTLTVTGKQLDMTTLTAAHIIGGYDSTTGKDSGIEVIRQVYPKLGMVPGLLLAPGWSKNATVAAALIAKTKDLNGLFQCEAVIDIDTETYKTYTAMQTAKTAMSLNDPHAVPVWPMVKYDDQIYNMSTVWAARAAAMDAEHEDIPYWTPSNIYTPATAAVLKDGTEVVLDIPQAEVPNGLGVTILFNDNGWKVWGTRTAASSDSESVKDKFIACRRMMNWYRNHFILTYKEKIDNPADRRMTQAVVDSENIFLNSLESSGVIAGGRIAFNESENPVTQIMAGKIVFHINIAFWTPAEVIEGIIEFDPTILAAAFGGE